MCVCVFVHMPAVSKVSMLMVISWCVNYTHFKDAQQCSGLLLHLYDQCLLQNVWVCVCVSLCPSTVSVRMKAYFNCCHGNRVLPEKSRFKEGISLSLAPSLLVFFLLFLLFSSIPLSNLSPSLLLLFFFSFLKKIFYASHWGPPQFASLFVPFARPPPLLFSFLMPLISPPSIHPSRFSGPSWRVVCSWLLTQGPVISADEPPAISLG